MPGRTRMHGRWAAAAALWLLALGLPAAAQNQQLQRYKKRPVELERAEDHWRLSIACPEVFSERVRGRLSSGFTSRLLFNAQLTDRRGETLVAQGVRQLTIRYDIWEERYNVRVEDSGQQRFVQLGSMRELVEQFGAIRRLKLMRLLEPRPDKRHRVVLRVVVNPTSRELRRKVREYLANPDGRSSIGVPSSFFGSFSRIFVDESRIKADRVLVFKSRKLDLPAAEDD